MGVVDGDLLALRPVPAGPAAPGIVEDIADAAMIFSTSRLKPWGTAHIQRGALAAAIVVAFLATGLGVTYRVATGALSGLFAVGVIAALTASGGPADHGAFRARRNGTVDRGLGAHRRGPGVGGARRLRAGATDAGRGRRNRVVADRPDGSGPERERIVGFFTATAVVGAGVLLAAGAELLWHLPMLTSAAGWSWRSAGHH